jgi:hypothetical protein
VFGILVLFASACGAMPPEKKPLAGSFESDGSAADVDLNSPFALACGKDIRIQAFGNSLEEAFQLLCVGDFKPSGTFVKTLAGSPWSGESSPKIFRIGEAEHDNAFRTTKLTGGGSVLVPITSRQFAEMSLLYAAHPELALQHGIKLVDGLKSERKLGESPGESGGALIGKVTSRLLIEKVINHQRIVIEYDAVRAYLNLGRDVFLVTTQLTRPIQGIKDMYSIGIAYPWNQSVAVTSLIMTKTDNKNQPGVAAEALLKTFKEGIQNLRANAVVMGERSHEARHHDSDPEAGCFYDVGRCNE